MTEKELWWTSLITDGPQAGFELAIKRSRMGVKSAQPEMEVRKDYANDASGLTTALQVVAMNFQTISAADNHWR